MYKRIYTWYYTYFPVRKYNRDYLLKYIVNEIPLPDDCIRIQFKAKDMHAALNKADRVLKALNNAGDIIYEYASV